jgi:hypothetical protein
MYHPGGEKSPSFGGFKILLKDGVFFGKYENLIDILEFVPCSIGNLKSHIKWGRGGLICKHWQIYYEKDYYEKKESK